MQAIEDLKNMNQQLDQSWIQLNKPELKNKKQ